MTTSLSFCKLKFEWVGPVLSSLWILDPIPSTIGSRRLLSSSDLCCITAEREGLSLLVHTLEPIVLIMSSYRKNQVAALLVALASSIALLADLSDAFVVQRPLSTPSRPSSTVFSELKERTQEETKTSDSIEEESPSSDNKEDEKEVEGLPFWWEAVWKLDIMKKGEPGKEIIFGDSANVLRTNIEQIYGGYDSLDGCPLAEGELNDIADGTMFIGLQNYQNRYQSPYKLCFGPKSFLVVSDPVQAKHILRDANTMYDKGILAEILAPIMGKGLIPADPETWSVRRRQIVPAFHKAWLEHMVGLFGYCNKPLIDALNQCIEKDHGQAEMETYFCSVALDIIGLSIFNYEFGSVTNESPVIKAVYSALVEAEHRSMTPAPYWDLPLANQVVPRLRKFNADLQLLNEVLNDLITRAKQTRQVEDIEELENRNYAEVQDPSMLRFLVDMRGADIDNKQLRDDVSGALLYVSLLFHCELSRYSPSLPEITLWFVLLVSASWFFSIPHPTHSS